MDSNLQQLAEGLTVTQMTRRGTRSLGFLWLLPFARNCMQVIYFAGKHKGIQRAPPGYYIKSSTTTWIDPRHRTQTLLSQALVLVHFTVNLPIKVSGTPHVSMMHYVNKWKLYASKDTAQTEIETVIKTFLSPIFARLNDNTHDNIPALIHTEEYH